MKSDTSAHQQKLFYRIGYTSEMFGMLDFLSGAAGREISQGIARAISRCYTLTQPQIVEVVRRNLELLLGQPASREMARETFHQFALGIADYLTVGNLPLRDATSLCTERHGLENLRVVEAQNRGAVLAAGHFGFFEFGSVLLAELGIPTTALTLAEPSEELTRWRADFRKRWGVETIEIGGDAFSSLEVVRAIQAGSFCAMLVDRPLPGTNLPVQLPGGTIPFSTAAALMAYLANCPILPVSVTRRRDGFYCMKAGVPVELNRSLPKKEAIALATQEVARSLIAVFQTAPEQWYHFIPLSQPSF